MKDDYRPISILPTIINIIERAVHTQLCKHLECNDILPAVEFYFRQRRSTEKALINFTDRILESMDIGQVMGAVSFDLWKAFDTVDHTMFLFKS